MIHLESTSAPGPFSFPVPMALSIHDDGDTEKPVTSPDPGLGRVAKCSLIGKKFLLELEPSGQTGDLW